MAANKGLYWTIWSDATGDWIDVGRRYKEERALNDARQYAAKWWPDIHYRVTAPDGKLLWTSEVELAE